jgi:hypothetical protein
MSKQTQVTKARISVMVKQLGYAGFQLLLIMLLSNKGERLRGCVDLVMVSMIEN